MCLGECVCVCVIPLAGACFDHIPKEFTRLTHTGLVDVTFLVVFSGCLLLIDKASQKSIVYFFLIPDMNRPYLHPVFSSSVTNVTDSRVLQTSHSRIFFVRYECTGLESPPNIS